MNLPFPPRPSLPPVRFCRAKKQNKKTPCRFAADITVEHMRSQQSRITKHETYAMSIRKFARLSGAGITGRRVLVCVPPISKDHVGYRGGGALLGNLASTARQWYGGPRIDYRFDHHHRSGCCFPGGAVLRGLVTPIRSSVHCYSSPLVPSVSAVRHSSSRSDQLTDNNILNSSTHKQQHSFNQD